MSSFYYVVKKYFFIYQAKRYHKIFGLYGVGYGLTEKKAKERTRKK